MEAVVEKRRAEALNCLKPGHGGRAAAPGARVIASREVRDAKALLAANRAAQRKARPKLPPVTRGKCAPRVHDTGFLAFLRRQPCAVGPLGCDGPVQAAHIRTHLPGELPTGLGRKPDDSRATGLCAKHHAEQHDMNEMAWWIGHGRDPFAIAARLFAAYMKGSA